MTGILMELALPCQLLITVIYWTLLHTHMEEELKKKGIEDSVIYFIFVFVHIQPFLTILIQIYISKIRFIGSHRFYMIILGIIYLPVNFIGTKYYGEPIYPFMTWEDYKSPLIGLILVLIGYTSFDSFCRRVNRFEFENSTPQKKKH